MRGESNSLIETTHYKTVMLKLGPLEASAGRSVTITQNFFITCEEGGNYGLILVEDPLDCEGESRCGRIDDFFGNRQEVVTFLNLFIRNEATLITLNDIFRDYMYEKMEGCYNECSELHHNQH